MPDGKPFIQKGMIDSHFHLLEMQKKELQLDVELRLCGDSGMFALLDVGVEPDDLSKRTKFFREEPRMLFAAGIYPAKAAPLKSEQELDGLMALLEAEIEKSTIKPAAIGECGIDLYHDYGSVQMQRALMERQIDLANRLEVPLIVHNRQADSEVYDCLKSNRLKAGGIMHCFSSDKKAAFSFADLGFKISFSGNITYRNSPDIEEAARKLPAGALLAETDSPYLTPQPVRKYFNVPSYIGYVYEKIAVLRNRHTADMVSQIKRNFIELFPVLED